MFLPSSHCTGFHTVVVAPCQHLAEHVRRIAIGLPHESAYTPSVVAAFLWPSRPLTVRTGSPPANRRVAAKCRRSWSLTSQRRSFDRTRMNALVTSFGTEGFDESCAREKPLGRFADANA